MKKMIASLLMVAVVLSGLNVSRVQSEAAENNPTNEVQIENPEQSTNEWNNQEDNVKISNGSETDTLQSNSDTNQTEKEIENETDLKAQEDIKTEESQNTDDPETTDCANSWRYEDGVLLHQDGTTGFGRSRARAAYNPNTTRTGIDVSYHNGTINWEQVKASGVDFVIIRCGYGRDERGQDDRQWYRNVSECERLGIPFGVYLYSYAKDTDSARSEAQHVLRLISGHNLTYPVYYDMEDDSTIGCDLTSIATTFCNTIKSAGYAVGVYASLSWWNTYLTAPCFGQWYRWVAQYNSTCKYTGEYAIWQYSSTGRVSGISTDVDMNYLIGYPKDHGAASSINIPDETQNIISYSAHVSDIGWMNSVSNGLIAGTVGQSRQLEALKLNVDENKGINISYQTKVKDEGWQESVSNNEIAGTVGKGLTIEAIRIQLTGENASKYDIYYRTYINNIGWLDWAKNGEQSGSDAYSIEAYQIAVLPAGNKAPGKTVYTYHTVDMEMEAHVSDIGWQNKENNGNIIGTTGKAKGIEAYSLSVAKENLGISYASCINGEWQQEVKDGQTSGTTGQAKHIEAIKIQLTGTEKENYHVYYRVHVSNIGWLDWTCDGEAAGTKNYNYPIEAIQIEVVSSDSDNIPEVGEAYKEKIDNVRYCAHVSDIGWQSSVTNGDIAGTTGKNKAIEALKIETDLENLNIEYTSCNKKDEWQSWTNKGEATGTVGAAKALEAIKIKLSGESSSEYHVYYRVYVSNFGWLDWTSDGEPAGTNGYGYNIEALQIKVMKEGESEIPELGESYREKGKGISYRAHVRNLGWQQYVENGNQAGTTGKALCVEALQIEKPNIEYDGNIEYRAHVSDIGWQNWVNDGEVAGTTGRAKAIEAIQIKLTGELAEHYDIEYRTHVSDVGWQDWVKNGEVAGTTGRAKSVEAIQIKLVKK